jgi:competence protein ComEA
VETESEPDQPADEEQATAAWQDTTAVEFEPAGESQVDDYLEEENLLEPEDQETGAALPEQLTTESQDEEEMPELPAWLADAEGTFEDEALEWTPPARTIKPVELNQASLVELERLPGIGFRLAQEIIIYREQHGLFRDLDQLSQVPGAEDLNLKDLASFLILPERIEPTPETEPSGSGLTFEEASESPELEAARKALLEADLPTGLQIYTQLIEGQQALPEIIQDLEEAVKYQPDSFELWQTLGDAYHRSNQTREALAAYLKAEEQLG